MIAPQPAPIIAVCGAGHCDDQLAALAEAGAILVCGGLGGVMEAACREARNAIIVHTAAVVITIGGEYGTLSEIALARKRGKPVIGLNSWELGAEPDGRPRVLRVSTAQDAVAQALSLARQLD